MPPHSVGYKVPPLNFQMTFKIEVRVEVAAVSWRLFALGELHVSAKLAMDQGNKLSKTSKFYQSSVQMTSLLFSSSYPRLAIEILSILSPNDRVEPAAVDFFDTNLRVGFQQSIDPFRSENGNFLEAGVFPKMHL